MVVIFYVVVIFLVLFGLVIVVSVMNFVFVVFDKYWLYIVFFNCYCYWRNRKWNSKVIVKLNFVKIDVVDNWLCGRFYSV